MSNGFIPLAKVPEAIIDPDYSPPPAFRSAFSRELGH
jgi:hypothetical protein